MNVSRRVVISTLLVLAGLVGGVVTVFGDKPAENKPSADQEAVHKLLESLANSFNDGDAKGVAANFTATGEFVDDEGNRAEGPAAIEALFAKFFADNKGAKLQLTPNGTRTVAPGVAVEDGESVVTVPDKGTQSGRTYAMIFAKIDGNWKVASVREYPEDDEPISPAEKLKPLEFLVGDWVDEGDDSVLSVSCKWAADKSHLIREFSVRQEGKEVMKGTQRIGVDPMTGSIMGWAFDSEGGRGESTWTQAGNEWLVRGSGVTGDGEAAAATSIIKPITKDRIEWKTMHKVVDDKVQLDDTAILVRKLVK
jgi:uncharacterized protein (TIGR02246 family)